jgi:CheY-like chemotaxis protein
MRHLGMSSTQIRKRPTKTTVLIADDDRDARIIYSTYLRAKGCHVIVAANGRAALDKAKRLRPDVIVMDLAMPRLNGWAAVRWLRCFEVTHDTPVIALSAAHTARESAHEAGCDRFIAKPCLPEMLWWHVRALAGLS